MDLFKFKSSKKGSSGDQASRQSSTPAYFGLNEMMAFCKVDLGDESGRTPLSWAAGHGQEACVWLLVERDGVDIDARDNKGVTPFMYAAKGGQEAVVRLLIERNGLDINARDNDGRTPLIWAAWYGYL